MKHGQMVYLKGGKSPKLVEVMRDHSRDEPPFNAVTIKKGQSEWIVGLDDIMTQEEEKAYLDSKNKVNSGVPF